MVPFAMVGALKIAHDLAKQARYSPSTVVRLIGAAGATATLCYGFDTVILPSLLEGRALLTWQRQQAEQRRRQAEQQLKQEQQDVERECTRQAWMRKQQERLEQQTTETPKPKV